MKKIERAAYFLKENMQLMRCPHCHASFESVELNQLTCQNNHSFNIAKKGTVYFLLNAKKDQYTKELFTSRQRIADIGFWNPILDEISSKISLDDQTILDIGCGNGSHLSKIKENHPQLTSIGFDISKSGIEMAATHYTNSFWCVADLANMPFADSTFDVLLNIFTSSNYQEFNRLLKTGGQVIKVVPNSNYLKELREFSNQKEYSNEQVVNHFYDEFPDAENIPLTYQVEIPNSHISDFVKMTPLGWNIPKDRLVSLTNSKHLTITVDINILIGKK